MPTGPARAASLDKRPEPRRGLHVVVCCRAGRSRSAHPHLTAAPRLLVRDPDKDAYLATPEDMVLQKLLWYRQGGGVSDQQWQDVLGILKVQSRSIDLDYLSRWASVEGLAELLQKALEQAGIAPRPPAA